MSSADPGYGDPNAPIGSVEWAKRWRLGFQSAIKDLPYAPQRSFRYLEIGQQHRAWTLLTNKNGQPYPTFDSFCRDLQPWGLGVDPVKFRAHLAAELGEKSADLVTVSPDGRAGNGANQHTGAREDSGHHVPNPAQEKKEKRLRAILRAPEVVQALYTDGLINQTDAAALGPKSPSPEQAATIAEARQELEQLDRSTPPREFRAQAKRIVATRLGKHAEPSGLDLLRKAWKKATPAEKDQFMTEVNEAGW